MEKQFLPYELALELKELGFDEECLALWQSHKENKPYLNINAPRNIKYLISGGIINQDVNYIVKAPLYQQSFDWFREKYNLHIEVRSYTAKKFSYVIQELNNIVEYKCYSSHKTAYNTFEEARIKCLEKLIEIYKQSNK